MANKDAMLDKIARNMKQRGVAAERVADTVEVTKTGGDILTVSYVEKSVQKPMGGVDGSVSPFLGIGVAAPGSLKIKGEAGENTVAAIMDTAEALELMHELAGYANDVIVEAGDTTTQLARVKGSADSIGLGM
jgi:hypothetical protein